MIEFKSKNCILLTGAGFTKNFGGFLGSEMWRQILHQKEIQTNKNLREKLLTNTDFESVYSSILDSNDFSKEDKSIMKYIIERVYKNLDDIIISNFNNPSNPKWEKWGDIATMFLGKGGKEKGLFFTLNQDTLIERRSGFYSPGILSTFSENLHNNSLAPLSHFDTLLENKKDIEIRIDEAEKNLKNEKKGLKNIAYIKLHGSYGWKSSDGSNLMVIGVNKLELIEKEPLLKWYLELFKKVIAEGNKKILIVGYGFRDRHINQILADGVEKYELQINVISTQSEVDLKRHFECGGHFYALPIWNGLRHYFHCTLEEFFSRDDYLKTITSYFS
ncbi:MAG: SIR2 family protein [bacterium]|nr:SIR2 family protein [bacterium]